MRFIVLIGDERLIRHRVVANNIRKPFQRTREEEEAGASRAEPATRAGFRTWARLVSNQRPLACEAGSRCRGITRFHAWFQRFRLT